MEDDASKRFVDLEGLAYFLEKFKYAMAHNGSESAESSDEDKGTPEE